MLFIDREKITDEVAEHLKKYSIEVEDYDKVIDFVRQLPKETRLLLDPQKRHAAFMTMWPAHLCSAARALQG